MFFFFFFLLKIIHNLSPKGEKKSVTYIHFQSDITYVVVVGHLIQEKISTNLMIIKENNLLKGERRFGR